MDCIRYVVVHAPQFSAETAEYLRSQRGLKGSAAKRTDGSKIDALVCRQPVAIDQGGITLK